MRYTAMNRLLITGAAGFIGSNFVRYWHESNPEDNVVVLDALTYAGNRANLAFFGDANWLSFIQGSVCDQMVVETLLRDYQIDKLGLFVN